MTIQLGANSIGLASHITGLNSRLCNKLTGGSSDYYLGLWTTPYVPGNVYLAYQESGVTSPFVGLNDILSFIADGSAAIGEREDAAQQTIQYLQEHYNAVNVRHSYITTVKSQQGDCCSGGLFGVNVSECYGNQGVESCCWNSGDYSSAAGSSQVLKTAISDWLIQFQNQLTLIQAFQADELNDAQLQSAINLEISKVNQAIAKTKSLQEQVKVTEFLGKSIRYVLPLVALVVVFYGWNVLKRK